MWSISKCGDYRIELLNRDNFEAALEVIRTGFCQDEAVCVGSEVNRSAGAVEELLELSADTALDGVSIVCVKVDSRKVVAASFNKLQVPPSDDGAESFFEKFTRERCKDPSSQSLIQFMSSVDAECNLFEKYHADCSLEIMFLATLREHRGKGLATLLLQDSISLAERLQNGPICSFTVEDLGPKYSAIPQRLVETKPPQICQAIFTSEILQGLSRKLGFTVNTRVSYERFVFNGRTYADRLGMKPSSCELASYVLHRKK